MEFLSLITSHSIRVIFIPPYSPHLNPIEAVFSQFKAFMRRHAMSLLAHRMTPEHLILNAFASIPKINVQNFIRASGYRM